MPAFPLILALVPIQAGVPRRASRSQPLGGWLTELLLKSVIAVEVVKETRAQGLMRPYWPGLSGTAPGGLLVLLPAPPLTKGSGVSVVWKLETVGWKTIDARPSGASGQV